MGPSIDGLQELPRCFEFFVLFDLPACRSIGCQGNSKAPRMRQVWCFLRPSRSETLATACTSRPQACRTSCLAHSKHHAAEVDSSPVGGAGGHCLKWGFFGLGACLRMLPRHPLKGPCEATGPKGCPSKDVGGLHCTFAGARDWCSAAFT